MKTLIRILVIPLLALLGCATIPRSGALNVEFELDDEEKNNQEKSRDR